MTFINSVKRTGNKIRASKEGIKAQLASSGLLPASRYSKLKKFKDIHKGERAFIIGNGPSLNEMNLSYLKDEITFVSNSFYLMYDKIDFIPTYYNIEDPLPAEDNSNEIQQLSGTEKIFAHDLRYCLGEDDNTYYTFFDRYYEKFPSKNFPKFSTNAVKKVYWGGTVAYLSLQLAYYMGIREMYLIGVDLNYDIPDSHEGGTVITSLEDDKNHFHPSYFGKGKRWHLPRVERMEQSFIYAAHFLQQQGGNLYNATVGGKLDSIERKNYNQLFDLENV